MLEKYKKNVFACSRCGMCIVGEAGYVCPIQQHTGGFDQYVARGRNQIAKAILNGELEYTKELADSAYTCLGCNACHSQCTRMDLMTGQPGYIDETKIQYALRVDLCKAGYEPEELQAVDTAIENWKNLPDEAKYDLAIAMYSDENGSAYFACDVERKGAEDGSVQADSLHLGAGQGGNGVEAHVKATQGALDMTVTTAEDGSTEIQAQITAEEMAADINEKHAADGSSETTIQATAQGMPLTIHIVEAVENEQKVAQVEVFLMGMENPLVTVHCVSGKGGEFVSVFEGEDITTVTMEQLGSTEDTTLAGQLQMNLISGLMQGIMTLGQHVPEDTALWLNTQLANMMSPDASTVTEGE